MLSLSELVRIYVCLTPTDMRKSFDSLAAVVREGLGYDPLSGHLFVFRSRHGEPTHLSRLFLFCDCRRDIPKFDGVVKATRG